MIKWLINLIYGATSAEFPSDYPLYESVGRLTEYVKPKAYYPYVQELALGVVTVSFVEVEHVRAMRRNAFSTFFVGSFVEREGITFLTGKFSLSLQARALATVLFAVSFVMILNGIYGFMFGKDDLQKMTGIAGMMMFGTVLLIVKLGKRYNTDDVVWLSKTIQSALNSPSTKKISETKANGSIQV